MSTHLDVKCRLSIVFFVGIQVPTLFRSVSFSRSSNLPKLSRRACDNSCAVWSPGGAHHDFLFMGFLGIENLMCIGICLIAVNAHTIIHIICIKYAHCLHHSTMFVQSPSILSVNDVFHIMHPRPLLEPWCQSERLRGGRFNRLG